MFVIIGFLVVCALVVGFFEMLEHLDPSRVRARSTDRRDAARLDALERVVLDRDDDLTTAEMRRTII